MAFDAGAIVARMELDRTPFAAGLRAARAEGEAFTRKPITVRVQVDADTAKADAALAVTEREADRLDGKNVKINVDRRGIAGVGLLGTALAALGIQSQVGTGAASSGLLSLGTTIATLAPLAAPVLAVTGAGVAALGTAFTAAGAGALSFGALTVTTLQKVSKVEDQVAQLRQKAATASGKQRDAYLAQVAALEGTLTPAERKLADALDGVKQRWDELQQALSPVLLKALAPWLHLITQNMGLLRLLIVPAATALRILGRGAQAALASPFWHKFFTELGSLGGTTLLAFGRSIGNLATGFAHLLAAFMPLARQMLPALVRMTAGFAQWAAGLSRSSGFHQFISYVRTNGPVLLHILGNVAVIAVKVLQGLAPLGAAMLKVLGGLTSVLAKLSPTQLMLIALGIAAALAVATGGVTAIVTAVVIAAALIVSHWKQIRNTTGAVWGAITGFLRGVAAWFAGPFVGFFVAAGHAIAAPFLWLWHSVMVPVWHGIRAVIQPFVIEFRLWMLLVRAALKATGIAASWLWRTAIAPAFHGIQAVTGAVWGWVNAHVLRPFGTGLHVVGNAATWLWRNAVAPAWRGLQATLSAGWNFIHDKVFSPLINFVTKTIPSAFRTGTSLAGKGFNTIRNLTKIPVNFVIGTVYDKGIRGIVGKIASWVGKSNPLPFIPQLAAGGPVPAAAAGVVNRPTAVVGEGSTTHPEYVIPTDPRYRARARGLWQQAGMQLMAGGGIIGWLTHPVQSFKDSIASPVSGLIQRFGANPWVQLLAAIPGKLTGEIAGKIKDMLGSVGGFIGGLFGGGHAVSATGPIARIVRATAAQFGWGSGAEWAALSWLINAESGWRPTAQNPTSTAFGLYQFLNGTWATVGGHKTSNPALQSLYGDRYIRGKYGDPLGAKRFHLSHGWYDTSTLANPGILPPGATLALNGTGRNEFVTDTPPAGADVVNLLRSIDRKLDRQQALVGSMTVNAQNAPARDVWAEIDHALRVAKYQMHLGV